MRAVIDTSVYESMLLSSRGSGTWLMALWKEQRFDNVVSPALLDELVEVIDRPAIRARLDPQRSLAVLRRLRYDAMWVEGMTLAAGLNDPQDNLLLSAALESQAEFIVTWDQDHLDQKTCQGVHIVNPDQFTSLVVRTT
jgi:putative PIN family toxin of toxin-antitoxin system